MRWTNTGLGNIKSAIIGTCRSCDPQHTEHYLAAFEYRFNRRFELDKMVERLARVAAHLPINRCRPDPSGDTGVNRKALGVRSSPMADDIDRDIYDLRGRALEIWRERLEKVRR